MARLAALVPPPRMHLTRYHGVFAPRSRLRAAITPAGRGAVGQGAKQGAEAPAVPKHVVMRWAQRPKRVFAIEIDTCARCQGRLRVIASIEEPAVILSHNHPSGVAEPSQADELITSRLRDALALVDIRVLDHVIVAGGEVVSLAQRGLI